MNFLPRLKFPVTSWSANDSWLLGSPTREDDISLESMVTSSNNPDYHIPPPFKGNSSETLDKGPYQRIEDSANDHTSAREEGFGLARRFTHHRQSAHSLAASHDSTDFEKGLAIGKKGWWSRQMLLDRSLRSMAFLMTLFALAMFVLCAAYFPDFLNRGNRRSTSVGGTKGQSCDKMESINVVLHLLINISATMILGMSNTYQQLVTSLKIDEVRWVLSKRGDSRIGTNSPLAINHKRDGKLAAWLSWILLILTSLPVHFLANSVIGPSWYILPPTNVAYAPFEPNAYTTNPPDFGCWSAFRTGAYHYPQDSYSFIDYSTQQDIMTFSSITVSYDVLNCTRYLNATNYSADLEGEYANIEGEYANIRDEFSRQVLGNCTENDVQCEYGGDESINCRINIRMQAALALAGCLMIKAIYMVIVNLKARYRVKSNCLTFGDVIAASLLEPEMRILNECMVNGGDGIRHRTSHVCHKHCTDTTYSKTGDELGHCQRCSKFNSVDKAADLVHPVISTKFKKSLISNLGVSAVTQMILLTFASAIMIALSIALAIYLGSAATGWNKCCKGSSPGDNEFCQTHMDCSVSRGTWLNSRFGGWGGFNSSVTLTTLPMDSLQSEQLSFAISNGAQLLYSMLYLLLVYNITLISMEHDWGQFEHKKQKLRCTIVRGEAFYQSYLLQLRKRVIFPLMGFSALMHWLLGQAISTTETVWSDPSIHISHSQYQVVYAIYPIWLSTVLMLAMTGTCWWAFTYKREGFMPQMYGSIRVCCSATTELESPGSDGIQWGDLGEGKLFRHAGFSASEVGKIQTAELYCGRNSLKEKTS